MTKWYVSRNGETVGPVEEARVTEWVRQGMTDAWVAEVGSAKWTQVGESKFLAPKSSPKVPQHPKSSKGTLIALLFFLGCGGVLGVSLYNHTVDQRAWNSVTPELAEKNSSSSAEEAQRKINIQEARRKALIPRNLVTEGLYDKVEMGMTYDQVWELVGDPGKEMSSAEAMGTKVTVRTWKNNDGSNMTLMFTGSRVSSKAQFGL